MEPIRRAVEDLAVAEVHLGVGERQREAEVRLGLRVRCEQLDCARLVAQPHDHLRAHQHRQRLLLTRRTLQAATHLVMFSWLREQGARGPRRLDTTAPRDGLRRIRRMLQPALTHLVAAERCVSAEDPHVARLPLALGRLGLLGTRLAAVGDARDLVVGAPAHDATLELRVSPRMALLWCID